MSCNVRTIRGPSSRRVTQWTSSHKNPQLQCRKILTGSLHASARAIKPKVLASSILLMNLLIAQLNSSYVYIYQVGPVQAAA